MLFLLLFVSLYFSTGSVIFCTLILILRVRRQSLFFIVFLLGWLEALSFVDDKEVLTV